MGLSSNSIIHFTKTGEALKGILERNFKICYCKEAITLDSEEFGFVVPMVSFCDIPLSAIKDHIDKYGNYGIGFTKDWAERQGLNPVLYVEKGSILSRSFDCAYESFVRAPEGDIHDLNEAQRSVLDMFRYIKNYQGDLVRRKKTIKDYRFSDEREWRYVPHMDANCDMTISLKSFEADGNEAEVKKCIQKLSSLELTFEPNDIKYIIINDESEIPEFISFLQETKGKKYSYQDVQRLTTRILTVEQIKSDI